MLKCSVQIDRLEIPPEKIRKAKNDLLKRAAFQIRAIALELVNVPGGRGRSSKPGEPPRRRSGKLRKSILYNVSNAKGTADIGITRQKRGFYGNFHEWGGKQKKLVSFEYRRNAKGQFIETKPGSGVFKKKNKKYETKTIPERPFMRPALQKFLTH